MKSHTSILNCNILVLSACLFFLSPVTGKFFSPGGVVKGETYALTLSTDDSKMLDSRSGVLKVESFKNGTEDALDVGDDNGRRWQFCDGIPSEGGSIYSVGGGGGGGYLYYAAQGPAIYQGRPGPPKLRTTGKKMTNLVTAHREGEGIKLKLPSKDNKSDEGWLGGQWLDEKLWTASGAPAIWKITKTTDREGWEAKCQ